jgi:general secretion pathway protein E
MAQGIGDILVAQGVLTQEQLDQCKQQIAQKGGTLQSCFIEHNMLSAIDIARALAEYASLTFVETIADAMADTDLLAQVPLSFLRDNQIMPVIIEGQRTLLTSNPLNFQPLDELNSLLGGGFVYAVAPASAIVDAVNRYYPLEGSKQAIEELGREQELEDVEFQAVEEKDIVAMAAEAPIIKLVNNILFQAVKRDASDIHIEPFEKELRVRYRIDGIMYDVMTPPKRIQGALVSRIKIMAHLNIAEKRIPQDGRIDIKVSGKAIDIRVSVLPVAFGERIVMRLLDKTRSFAALDQLGFSERDMSVILKNIVRPNGIIYVTGPTGSGKTTTLYSILSRLNTPEVNIITVEDPVEYQMAGIGQVQVKDKVGLTFAVALRSILRQDPDIVMIGETRDQETAQIAVQAALTGHLVLSTLHTNNAPATITRLLDMGVEPFLIASSIILAMAQRLVRKLCPTCKKPTKPPVELLKSLSMKVEGTFYEAVGCNECLQTGYKGRIPIFELMEMTPDLGKLTMARADTATLRAQAMADGMTLLVHDGLVKASQGLTTVDEVLSVATAQEGMTDA